jgi:DNA-binding HxlR family transcriptional regulator
MIRRRRPSPVGGCPLTAALAAIGGKWKLIIVSDGLVHRQPTGELPAPVEYSLTDYGRSVLPWPRTFVAGGGHTWSA